MFSVLNEKLVALPDHALIHRAAAMTVGQNKMIQKPRRLRAVNWLGDFLLFVNRRNVTRDRLID